MIFTEFAFLVFFAFLFSIYWLATPRVKTILLLTASYVFYAWWDWRFVALLAGVTGVTWLTGMLCLNYRTQSRTVIAFGLMILLLQLSVFKYSGFILDILTNILPHEMRPIADKRFTVVLPVGISFFTFQAMSYLIDIGRKEVQTNRSLSETALYISFFPQLVAGPIIRSNVFFPQLRKQPKLRNKDVVVGINCFLIGFLYKTIFADQLAPFVDQVFAQPEIYRPHIIWFGLMGFSAQIYFDFAGYSMMAIGVARLLGFRFPQNFDHPYCSLSLIEFWKRWHISLSQWFRDYLYISIGGNRKGERRKSISLLVTMTLCGLWHGASWNFMIWGFLHGIGAWVNHHWRDYSAGKNTNVKSRIGISIFLSWILTQVFVLFSWIPFRAESFSDIILMFKMLFGYLPGLYPYENPSTVVPYLLITTPLAIDTIFGFIKKRIRIYHLPSPVYWFGLGAILAGVLMLVPLQSRNFVYFQF